MSATNEDIIRRITALMNKTTSNGCSEAEAMAASEMASRLMNKYQLSLTDIKLKETANCMEGVMSGGQKNGPPSYMCANAVAHLTDTIVWKRRGDHGISELVFFGMETDVAVAKYIWHIVDRAMLWAWMEYKSNINYKGMTTGERRKAQNSFDEGMANRINSKLWEMKKVQSAENRASTGRDLMVVKKAIVEAEFAKLGFSLSGGSARRSRADYDHKAYSAGHSAGGRVEFNAGIGASAPKGSIQ